MMKVAVSLSTVSRLIPYISYKLMIQMKNLSVFVLSIALFCGCVNAQDHSFAKLPDPKPNEKTGDFCRGLFLGHGRGYE